MADGTVPRLEKTAPRPRPRYTLVLLVLVVFTGLEVAASTLPEPLRIPILVALAATKAGLVILFFMHLKFDPRLYALWFILGAIIVFPLVVTLVILVPMIPMLH